MNLSMSHENELLLNTVKSFLEDEIYPYEEEVDRTGQVPIELGRQIEDRAKKLVFSLPIYPKTSVAVG